MEKIGCLSVADTNSVSGSFWLPRGYDPRLGLSIMDSHLSNFQQTITLSTNLAHLRIAVELFETNAAAPFYRATVLLEQNMAHAGQWLPNLGVFVGGIEPLPYVWPHTNSGATQSYLEGRDVFPLSGGRLTATREYRVRISVKEAIAMRNEVCFWIYLRPARGWASKGNRRL